MKLTNIALITLIVSISSNTVAEEAISNTNGGSWNAEVSFEFLGLDGDKAEQEQVKDRSNAIGLYANYSQNDWVTSLRTSFIFYSDEAEFSQTVRYVGGYNDGDVKRASSKATALTLGFATGKQWHLGDTPDTVALLQVGYDHLFASERSIKNCESCRSEAIDIDGGAFLQAGLKRNTESISIGVTWTQYLTGDGLNNRLALILGSRF